MSFTSSSRLKRILFLIPVLKDGSGRFLTFLAKGLVERGWSIEVVSASKSGSWQEWPHLRLELSKKGVLFHEIDFFDRSSESFWSGVDRLAEILKKGNFSLLAPQSCVPASACLIVRDLLGIRCPIVLTLHSWGTGRPSWMNLWDTWALRRVDHICFVSYGYREAFLKSIFYQVDYEKTSVIRPGLYIKDSYPPKPSLRQSLSEVYGVSSDSFWIVTLGGISERKGTLELVMAFARLIEEGHNAYLFLIGPVREKAYFNDVLSFSRKARGRVKFMGLMNDPYPLVKASDLFVFPSRSEGLGSALMEAMALEVPCASTNFEGLNDLVCNGKYAILIKEMSVEEILRALKEALEGFSSARETARLARERVLREFSFNRTVENYEKLYYRFIKNFSPSL